MKNFTLFILFLLAVGKTVGQVPVAGQVTDYNGNSLEDVEIRLLPLGVLDFSSASGEFSFSRIKSGKYTIIARRLGYQDYNRTITVGETAINNLIIQMDDDPLELSGVVVTGTFTSESKLRASSSISTIGTQQIQQQAAIGTADLLRAVPSVFTDASAGEVFTRVYSRGISASAEDDIGWYYVGLQEDGLPVTLINNTFYGPDFFHRVDLTVQRLEAVRGGISTITGTNTPGAIFNFISKTGGPKNTGQVALTSALQGENNTMIRADFNTGGPLFNQTWSYNVGGFYRSDQGVRNVDYNWSQGGQVKFNLIKKNSNGLFKLYGKYLNDKVNRFTGLPAVDWNEPEAAFGFDFNTTALMLPEVESSLPDGRNIENDPNAFLTYNPANGIRTKDLAAGLDIIQSFADWTVRNNFKFTTKETDWQTTIANQRLGLESFLPYFLSGAESPFGGNVIFKEVNTGNTLARVNNLGAANVFRGLPPSFEYLEGRLPNDALMGIAPWKRLDEVDEWMNQLSLSKSFRNHKLTFGTFIGSANIDAYTQASYAYATYEAEPRLLQVSIEDPNSPNQQLSDENGLSGYGGLLYRNGTARTNQFALFVREEWTIRDILTIDIGARYERINHNGNKDRFGPLNRDGGLDNDLMTAFDNGILVKTGTDDFDFTYDYLSYSIGTNYLVDDQISLFARFSKGNKAPELNYYFNNFANIPIDRAGNVQNILQMEGGLKLNRRTFSLLATAFWSRLGNIPFSEFVFDEDDGQLFFTPVQFNTTNTFGVEVEGLYAPSGIFNLNFSATLQNPEATKFTIYNAAGTADTDDDFIEDYSGKTLPHTPGIMLNVTPEIRKEFWYAYATWRFMSEREANFANAFSLPTFSVFNVGGGMEIWDDLNVSLIINNIFNGKGLMNFFGPNEFGSNANAATMEFIEANPDASFVVFPINPRMLQLRIAYGF